MNAGTYKVAKYEVQRLIYKTKNALLAKTCSKYREIERTVENFEDYLTL